MTVLGLRRTVSSIGKTLARAGKGVGFGGLWENAREFPGNSYKSTADAKTRAERSTMAHEEKGHGRPRVAAQTTRSRGKSEGARVRGMQMAQDTDRSIQ